MSQFQNPFGTPRVVTDGRVSQASLVSFFNAVYAWMASGLALTGLVAFWVSTQEHLMRQIFRGPTLMVLFLAEIGLVIVISAFIRKLDAIVATMLFMLYSALNGLTLSVIFLVYTHTTIVSAFFVTAGTFAAMSVFGMVTRRDLTKLGSLCFMALIGLILATVVNMFLQSSGLYWLTTYVGVLIFVGLTAYDTQKLKLLAMSTEGDAVMLSRLSVYGALDLYLDFINLFLFILRIMGDRRR